MKPKILIVEDDKALRSLLCGICEDKGCEVTAACDGREALELIDKEEFVLVIADVRMPRLNGLDMMKEIHKRDVDVPVILMSGHSDYSAEEIDANDGVVLLEKPFTRRQIEEIIDQFVELI